MPNYAYNAVTQDGRETGGQIAAATRPQAIALLAQRGAYVTTLEEHAEAPGDAAAVPAVGPAKVSARAGVLWWWSRGVTPRQKTMVLAQLSTALEAGLPLLAALEIVQEQSDTKALRDLTARLASQVQAGQSLSEACRDHPRQFSALEVSMVRVGETAGVLEQVMASLASFAERDLDFRDRLRGAAMYPLLVLGLAGASVIVVLTFILPRILATVADAAASLPWPTRVLMAGSDLLRDWGWLLAILAGLGAWRFRGWLATPGGRIAFDRFKLRIPVLGTALRRVAIARFARTLGTLSRAGIGIIESLRVLRGTLGNEALAVKIDEVSAGITQGKSIAEPLKQTGEFPPLLIQVIAMGERTGRLDELLLKVADAYEKETAAAIQRVMSVLPAVLIMVLALIVVFVLAAVLLPIVGMELAPPGT